ncbi:MAG: NAD(P)H-binding protein [Candidatus Dormibacteraeota bacterium]|nr:NAD(P)H-binding protein [Candidatus Dormibacteraeota bacterium]
MPDDRPEALVERLCRAVNEHDLDALEGCFAAGYRNETPAHPGRGFVGRAQARRNWEQIFAAVPDISAQVRSVAVGNTVWSEWEMQGTRRDGSAHQMRGVVIFGVNRGEAAWARFYLEPVEAGGGDVDDAVRRAVTPAAGSERGLQVRVLTRDAARVPSLPGLEVAVGDVRVPGDLPPAMAGVDTVASAIHGFAGPGGVTPASVDRDGNAHLIDAAAAVGAAVVLVSIVGASPDSPMELFRMKAAAEQHLRASGVSWTIVRATAFLELWIGLLEQTAGRSGRPVVFGRGDNPINFVAVDDVAALVERAATDPSTRGLALEIGGPENLTLNQLAAAVQAAAGRSRQPRHVPRAMLRLMAGAARPFRPELARQALAALAMDTVDLTFDATAIHDAYPELPLTSLTEVLTARLSSGASAGERTSRTLSRRSAAGK